MNLDYVHRLSDTHHCSNFLVLLFVILYFWFYLMIFINPLSFWCQSLRLFDDVDDLALMHQMVSLNRQLRGSGQLFEVAGSYRGQM